MNLPDTLFLWWLGRPDQPVYVGELRTVRTMRGVSLAYAASWLQNGFALSEDLPLRSGEHMPTEKDTAAGAVDDSRPDRWGERVIRYIDKPLRLGLLDFLYWSGDERFGALGVSVSPYQYAPRWSGPLPTLEDVPTLQSLVDQVLRNEPLAPELQRLIAPGGTLGGAKPKALAMIDGQAWVIKFQEPADLFNTPLVEHATLTLAALAGIQVAETRVITLPQSRHALAVKRFDRAHGQRLHALSAHVVLRAAGEPMGYPELAQWLRRHAPASSYRAQMAELFRRMVFNILIDNTDDHEKNHVVLMNEQGQFTLSQAFDVLPMAQGLAYQQMRVGRDGLDATLDNALSEHAQFGLSLPEAKAQVRQVSQVTQHWKAHFSALGVRVRDMDTLAAGIDKPR
ncbi:MAG: hypothetical protein RLZZ591_2613 [Pseudomonadota bacterium]|jgi:serine/threonine-protein kinase HipA